MKEIRLCLTGELRSGKSTLAEYAEDTHYMMPFAFGDELKAAFHKEYAHTPAHPKPRRGYQLFGQLQRYVHGEDYWLNKCFEEIEKVRKTAIGYNKEVLAMAENPVSMAERPRVESMFMPLITDARQPNEFDACRREGYAIIKVVASEELRIQRAKEAGDRFNPEDFLHETETFVSQVAADYIVVNNGSKEELYAQFDKIMDELLTEKASA